MRCRSWSYEHLTEHQYAVCTICDRPECDLRRRYLETTFTELILDLQDDLNDLQRGRAARRRGRLMNALAWKGVSASSRSARRYDWPSST